MVSAIRDDTPLPSEKVINKIIQADSPHADTIIASLESQIQPMCGIYHRSLEDKFINMVKTNNHKLGLLIKSSNTTLVNFEDEKLFLNLNHPHEYQEALTLI